MRTLCFLACLFVGPFVQAQVPADHAAKMTASAKLFKDTVRTFFKTQCLDCHGGEKTKSGFNMATREKLLEGGDRGASIVPGKAKESRLYKLVTREEEPHMPPKKPADKATLEALAAWIDSGAAYDAPLLDTVASGKKPLVVTEKDKAAWAYRALVPVPVPTVKQADWPKNPIDNFILAKLETAKLTPSADADKLVLLRRVTFDLTGLPPTVKEQDEFLADTSAKAYEKVVDRLLASPAFGERWARHWLDPARYAESHGFEHDYFRPHAYHYRDFVIKALNNDMPYDQFVAWQLAGDELAPNDPQALAATGFLGAGVYPTQITNREAERVRYDAMDDMLSTTGHAFLALTVGCARCHDHKYDPIPTKDYYRLLATFTTTVRSEVEVDLSSAEQKNAYTEWETKRKPLADAVTTYEGEGLGKALLNWLGDSTDKIEPISKLTDLKAATALKSLIDKKAKLEDLPKAQREAILKWYAPLDSEWKSLSFKLSEHDKLKPALTKTIIQATTEGRKPMRHHTADNSIPDFYKTTYLLKRGDADQKDGEVQPGFLQVLSRKEETTWTPTKPQQASTSYRRVHLANWILDTQHGAGSLAARVMVNRLWHHHFGRGIVSTLNDFGFQSDPATHPELLDWLANDFVQNKWGLKRLHKLMVMSRVYQLGNDVSADAAKADPDNRLLSHRTKRRLEAEAVRDNWLAVSGTLDAKMYGPGEDQESMRRRSIYFRIQRSQMIPSLQIFDWPDSLTSASARPTTTVAPQALYFLNSPHVGAGANALAQKLKPEVEKSADNGVTLAYRMTLGRAPTKEEREAGAAFLKSGPLEKTLPKYARVLFSLNEFVYVE
jgi:mono/diheme cytochrome c family protein